MVYHIWNHSLLRPHPSPLA